MADFKSPFSNTPGVEYKGQVYSVRGARLAALHELFGGSASVGPTQPTLSDLVDKAEQVAMILGWQPDGATSKPRKPRAKNVDWESAFAETHSVKTLAEKHDITERAVRKAAKRLNITTLV